MQAEEKRNIYVGTAGWSYKDWVGPFYERNAGRGYDFLRFYAHYFNTAEVNASYYTYIAPRVAESWINKLEGYEDFRFTVKLHKDFTHLRSYTKQNVKSVKYILDMLKQAERFGGMLVQFPYSFDCNYANAEYLMKIVNEFGDVPLFVELRHKSWVNDRVLNYLDKQDAALCSIDQPVIGEAVEFKVRVTGSRVYLRFHGRNKEAWQNSVKNFGKPMTYDQQNERYKYLYSTNEVLDFVVEVQKLSRKVKEIYVIMNNHPAGYAAANAFEFLLLLKEKERIDIPQTTLNAFEQIRKHVKTK